MGRLLSFSRARGGLRIVRGSGRSWPLPKDWQVTWLWLPSRYYLTTPARTTRGPIILLGDASKDAQCLLQALEGSHCPVTPEEGSQVLVL